MLTQRELSRYFKRRRYGGRSAPARVLDYVALRLILFLAAFLFFRLRMDAAHAAILAAIALAIATLVLHVVRDVTMERFVQRELRRIRTLLMRDRLMFLEPEAFRSLCRRAGNCDRPVALQRAEPVGADVLLPLLRGGNQAPPVVCSSAGFTPAAEDFVRRAPQRATLIGPDALVEAARETDALWPDDEAVHAYIAAQLQQHPRPRARLQELLSGAGAATRAKKYLLTGLVLLAASFLTRYTLYYRMLAGLCLMIAAAGALRRRTIQP